MRSKIIFEISLTFIEKGVSARAMKNAKGYTIVNTSLNIMGNFIIFFWKCWENLLDVLEKSFGSAYKIFCLIFLSSEFPVGKWFYILFYHSVL